MKNFHENKRRINALCCAYKKKTDTGNELNVLCNLYTWICDLSVTWELNSESASIASKFSVYLNHIEFFVAIFAKLAS